MVYMQFTSANDFNDVRGVVCRQEKFMRPGPKVLSLDSFKTSPIKAQSVSNLGYFQSVWNIHWKIWDIHKVLAVTFDLEEQLECSMKCFSLVVQKLKHWPRVGDIHLPLSTLLNGTNSHFPQLQGNTSGSARGRMSPSPLIMPLSGRAWESSRSIDLNTLRKNWQCSLLAGIHMKEQQFVYVQNKRKIKMKIRI